MPTLRIKVGASVDSSVATAFTAIEKAARSAREKIQKDFQGLGAAIGRGFSGGAGAGGVGGGGGLAGGAKSMTASVRALGPVADATAERFKLLTKQIKSMPADLNTVAREAQRALQSIEREKARAQLGLPSAGGGAMAGAGSRSRYWYPFGGAINIRKPTFSTLESDPIRGVARFGMGAAGFLRHAATGFARSMGVETGIGELVSRNVREETSAQDIVNAGYFPGQNGANGQLQNRGDILAQTRNVAINTGTDRGDILEGLRDFVGKTGDLALGRDILESMAKLSKATGSNMSDMVNASAEVSNALGDVQNKGQVIEQIMQQVAGQGKLGAVEIRDLATQMAKIASQAGKFEGGAAGNIALLGVLAQEAKLRGGATNASQATTGVARFVSLLTTKARVKTLQASGIDPFTDKSETVLRNPAEIIKQMLSKTGGNLVKLSTLVPNVMAMRPVQGLATVYNQALSNEAQRHDAYAKMHGGSMAGYTEAKGIDAAKLAAVDAELDNMKAAMLSDEEVNRAYAATMTTTQSKVTVFNERMADIVSHIQAGLLPALEKLAPTILGVAEEFANIVNGNKNVGDVFTDFYNWVEKITRAKSDQSESSELAANTGAETMNMIGRTKRWEQTHLITNAEGPVTPEMIQQNMANAGKVLDPIKAQETKIYDQLNPLQKRTQEEYDALNKWAHTSGHIRDPEAQLSQDAIAKMAGEGDKDAEKYIADKRTQADLIDTLQKLQGERTALIDLLRSGAVTVKVDKSTDKDTPPPVGGGAQPPGQPPEPDK